MQKAAKYGQNRDAVTACGHNTGHVAAVIGGGPTQHVKKVLDLAREATGLAFVALADFLVYL